MNNRWTILVLILLGCGIIQPVAAEKVGRSRLAKILVGRSETAKLKAIAILESDLAAKLSSMDELLFGLKRIANEDTRSPDLPPSSVRLIHLISTINRDEAEQALIDLLSHENMSVAMAVASALGEHQRTNAIDGIKMQTMRPEWKTHYGFRFNVIRALALMDHPEAYEFIGRLRKKLDGQLLHDINEIIEDLELDDLAGNEEIYADLKGTRVESTDAASRVRFASAKSLSESSSRMRLERQRYYGIDIEAKRILFIIDHSGSMRAPAYRGTRLARAKQTLIEAITELPADHEFGIIFFEKVVREWEDELVFASDSNKQAAIRFVMRLGLGSSTNTYGALRRSMTFDDDLEAVFLLTDGAPTTGDITAPKGILNDIGHRNRMRHLKINTIGIGLNAPTRNFLKALAEHCGGEFREPDRVN